MDAVVIDGALASSRDALHTLLAQQLSFPDYYGRNLDALYDLLTERQTPTQLVIQRRAALEAALGAYGAALLETLAGAAQENPALHVVFEAE